MPFPLPLFLALGAGAALLAMGKKSGAAAPTGPTAPTAPTGPTEPTAPTGPTVPTAPTTPTTSSTPLPAPTGLKDAIAQGRVDELITAALAKKDPRTMWALGFALTKEKDVQLQSKGQLLCAVALQTARKDGSLPAVAAEIVSRDNSPEIMAAIYAADLLASMPEEAPYKAVWIAMSTSLKALHSGASADAAENAATAEAAKDAATILNQGLMAAGTYLNELLKGDAKAAADQAAKEAAAAAAQAEKDRAAAAAKAEQDRIARETAAAAAAAAALKLPEYVVGTRTLKLTSPAMRGTDVRDLQATLNIQYGASPKLVIDGAFGSGTKAAVIAFQKGRYDKTGAPLTADGIVGANTWWALSTGGGKKGADTQVPPPQTTPSTTLPTYAVGTRTLKLISPPMKGTDVRDLQGTLNDQYGASPKLVVDGVFGSGTKTAVIAFQKGRYDSTGKALVADGVVGSNTWWALKTGGAKAPAVTAPTAPAPAPAPAPSTSLPIFVMGSRTLKVTSPYMKGTDVRDLQSTLNTQYGASPKLTLDGVYGTASRDAVKRFQANRYDSAGAPLVVDGVMGSKSWWALQTGGGAAPERADTQVPPLQNVSTTTTAAPMPASRGADVTLKLTSPYTKGAKVTELQELLNWRGTSPALVTDGVFGNNTLTAVKAFQGRHVDVTGAPLVVDGIVGTKTWWSLRYDGSGVVVSGVGGMENYPSIARSLQKIMLKPGMTGKGPALLQLGLNKWAQGGFKLKVDGNFGPKTTAAVKVAQIQNGQLPTGLVNKELWQKIIGSQS